MAVFQALVVLLKWPAARALVEQASDFQSNGRALAGEGFHIFQAHLIVRQNPPGEGPINSYSGASLVVFLGADSL